jgi:Flp pilus assembly protein TadD
MFELNAASPKAYTLRGSVRMQGGDARGAMDDFKRALVLDRNDPEALLWLGYRYAAAGRGALARALMERLQQVDPLTSINQTMCGIVAMFDGRYADALEWTQRSVDADPGNPTTRMMHAHALAANSRPDEAREVLTTIQREESPMAWARLACAMAYALSGDREQMLKSITPDLQAAAERDEIFSWWLADCHALVGEREAALDNVQRMIELGMFNYPFLAQHEPFLASIRGERRLRELLERAREQWEAFEP